MRQNIVALIVGLLFGLGLALSQMIDPARVLGFLDVIGTWDPTLMFVLGGAVGVTVIAFRFVLGRSAPILAPRFYLPTCQTMDPLLIGGSAIFGIGWGIAGYCPGPGITALVLGSWNPVLFVTALFAGSFVYSRVANRVGKQPQVNGTRSSTSTNRASTSSASGTRVAS